MTDTNKKQGNVWAGIGIGILVVFLILIVTSAFPNIITMVLGLLIFIGLIVYFFVKGKKQTAIGMLILLGIALLLVAACFGILFHNLG